MRIILRASVRRFAEDMERALRKHDQTRGARGWSKDDPLDLLARLREETGELAAALIDVGLLSNKAIRKEAADVGNFAMMIHDRSR